MLIRARLAAACCLWICSAELLQAADDEVALVQRSLNGPKDDSEWEAPLEPVEAAWPWPKIGPAWGRAHVSVAVPKQVQAVLPLDWVHVPKCGSSFINTLIHIPGVCDSSVIKPDFVVDQKMGGRFLREFSERYDLPTVCPGWRRALITGHNGIGAGRAYEKGAGHFIIMLRQPEKRVVSAYQDMAFVGSYARQELMDEARSWGGWFKEEVPPLKEYANKSAGCAVRMLTRGGFPCGAPSGVPTARDVEMAKQRLRTGFAFVGLTDQWALSMCLFSKMFKTGCNRNQFTNTRPGGNDEDDDGKAIRGWKDPYDGPLYEEAQDIFRRNLEKYDVSEATCAKCFSDAGVSVESIESDLFEDEQIM